MQFNKNRAGNIVSMTGGMVYQVRSDGEFVYAGADTGRNATVELTGWNTVTPRGTTMYQIVGGGWIDLMEGWRTVETATYSVKSAQQYVNEVIANNKIILQNNLLCARFANKLNAHQKATLRGLQQRLEARNQSLLADGLVSNVETSYPAGYAEWGAKLESFMTSSAGVGGIATTAIIVVSCVVIAATAAYFAYRAMASESKDDVRFSKDLTRTLTQKLTAEEYEQLKEETAGIVTKAKIRQSLSDLGTVGKVLLWGGLGIAAYILVTKKLKRV